MKKVLFFLIILLFPFIVLAVEADYEVKGYFAIHEINNDGSVTVREAIVLEGDMNGYERQLIKNNSKLESNDEINFEHDSIYNPKDITNIKVAAYKVKSNDLSYDIVNKDFSYSDKVKSARKGERNVYTINNGTDFITIRNHYSCSDCTVAFYFEYKLDGITVIHDDVAEIYYQLFSYNYVTEDMGVIDMRVTYPDEDKNALMWVHGNVYGEVKKSGTDKWKIYSDKFPKGSELDYRTVFDKSLITYDEELIHTNVEALPSIKEIEKKRAEERERELARIALYIKSIQIASLIYIIILIIFIIYIIFKYDREHKVSFNAKYYREFIEDYDVEVVDYLMNKTITPNAMSASIMNLVYKKKIKAEPLDDKHKDYKFTLLDETNISKNEERLIKFLFRRIGDGLTFTTNELKNYAKGAKTYDNFNDSYNIWTKNVKKEAEAQEFYSDLTDIKIKAGIYIFFGLILWFISIVSIDDFVFSHLLIIPLVIAAIYIIAFQKKTEKGQLHYKKWQAFKNFLNDFGTFDVKELPEIILWERYLVYATVFGLADKVQKAMNVRIKELESLGGYDTTPYFYYYGYSNFGNVVTHSISNAHNLAVSTAAAHQSSNSSGFGGGFSGGGGFGGGGGGGHGF